MGAKEVWIFIAGTALFIFAMSLVEESLKNLAGRSFKKILHKLTSNKFKSIVGGTGVTAILQSSSVVLLMTLSFVGAGIISMRNALAITLGSNLGTTLDSWIVAALGFKTNFSNISYILLSITILGIFFNKNKKLKNIFRFLVGFSLLFVGLDMMKESAGVVIKNFDLVQYAHLSPYLFIPIGIVITFLIQSSSATIAITLTALHNGALPFESAAAIVIGSELGTTLKLLIGSIGGNSDKKRVALGNFLFNLIMVVISASLLYLLTLLIKDVIGIKDDLLALVFFQTLLNVLGIVIFYPLLGFFAKLLEKTYTSKKKVVGLKFIKPAPLEFADDSLIKAEQEIIRLIKHTIEYNTITLHVQKISKGNTENGFSNYINNVFKPYQPELAYDQLKLLQGGIIEFLVQLPSDEMNYTDVQRAGVLIDASLNVIHAAKNFKDIAHNMEELDGNNNTKLQNDYLQIVLEQDQFYAEIKKQIPESTQMPNRELLEEMALKNKQRHQTKIDEALATIKLNEITELDASSLLNVYREIHSSNKALIEVLLYIGKKS